MMKQTERERAVAALAGAPAVGQRVQISPATDRWMMGDRYGEVVRFGSKGFFVRLDKSGKSLWFRREDVSPV